MRAVGFRQPLPISEAGSLLDLDLPRPKPAGRDLLVKVEAVSVNPVDTKVRRGMVPLEGDLHVLGWDAAGTVVEAGPEAARFEAGDAVYYAGELRRPGTNAEFHLVDERLVGRAVTEASGRITPATAGAVAASGVDLISTGWLTHSAPVLGIGLDHRG